jgi:putative phosphoribosyl transferase
MSSRQGVDIEIPPVGLRGWMSLPPEPKGLVIFAHGSGSSRFSPRNRQVARALADLGLAALLFDLLTPAEAETRANVFDIELLSGRLVQAVDWAQAQPALAGLPIGLFGASTGAASALEAAVRRPQIRAVVSRGGRPDLAPNLPGVSCPVLLIVGGEDEPVLTWNRAAAERLGGPSQVAVIEGATHLFEEPGAMDEVVRLAGAWFSDQLTARRLAP